MAGEIGRIFGGSNYGVGGYLPQRKNEEGVEAQAQQAQAQQNYEETQVDPQKVMDFLANNNYFMPVTEAKSAAEAGGVDSETENRIADYMKDFEFVYSVIEEEFGAELAPQVMDIAMDKLIGMAA